eukprot:TRINITY_DN6341_c0_g1_i5.p2 TRINITY_DN6341_c0_g1~~TRINITY_DN6341_c0_g1_i5.p2  ORF type:complete len:243 (-),score=-10.75 TRINITY_DN6341_c0_g1_i5:124-852(-)
MVVSYFTISLDINAKHVWIFKILDDDDYNNNIQVYNDVDLSQLDESYGIKIQSNLSQLKLLGTRIPKLLRTREFIRPKIEFRTKRQCQYIFQSERHFQIREQSTFQSEFKIRKENYSGQRGFRQGWLRLERLDQISNVLILSQLKLLGTRIPKLLRTREFIRPKIEFRTKRQCQYIFQSERHFQIREQSTFQSEFKIRKENYSGQRGFRQGWLRLERLDQISNVLNLLLQIIANSKLHFTIP